MRGAGVYLEGLKLKYNNSIITWSYVLSFLCLWKMIKHVEFRAGILMKICGVDWSFCDGLIDIHVNVHNNNWRLLNSVI